MARLSPPGCSLMRGRSLLIGVPSFAERDAVAPWIARADHHAILELHDIEAAPQLAFVDLVAEVFQRIAQVERAGAGLDQGRAVAVEDVRRRRGLSGRTAPVDHLDQRLRDIADDVGTAGRSEEHTSELQSQSNLVCRLLLEKKN